MMTPSPRAHSCAPRTTWLRSLFCRPRKGSGIGATGVFYVAATAVSCVSAAEEQGNYFARQDFASPLAFPVGPVELPRNDHVVSFQTEDLVPWYDLRAVSGGEAVSGAPALFRNYVRGSARLNEVPPSVRLRTQQLGVDSSTAAAAPVQGTRWSLAVSDVPAALPASLAPLPGSQQVSSSSDGLLTSTTNAFSTSAAAAALSSSTFVPVLESAFSSLSPSSRSGALLVAPTALLIGKPTGPPAFPASAVSTNISFPAKHSSTSASFLSTPHSAAVRASTPISGKANSPYVTTPPRARTSSAWGFYSATLGELESPLTGVGSSANAPSDAAAAVHASSRKLLHETPNRGSDADFSGGKQRFSTGMKPSSKNHGGRQARERQKTRKAHRTPHTPTYSRARKIRGTQQHCRLKKSETLGSRLTSRSRGCSAGRFIARDGGRDSVSKIPSRIPAVVKGAQIDRTERPEPGAGRKVSGNLLGSQPRKLGNQEDTSKDLLSNAPEPGALNYAFFRGFGKPRLSTFFAGSRASRVVPVVPPGVGLVQYTSNVALPVWGAIPNFPQNFGSI